MAATDKKALLKPVLYVLGIVLIFAAGWTAWQQTDLAVLRHAPIWAVLTLAVAVAGNLIVTAGLFHVVTRSFDAKPPVPFGRMFWLIAASALLNYLPMRAGLIGRAGYLKAKHALPLRQSVLILTIVLMLGGVVLGLPLLAVLLVPVHLQDMTCLLALLLLLAASPAISRLARKYAHRHAYAFWSWGPLRIVDLLIGAARMWLAFRVMGESISFSQATVAGAAGMLVSQLGITPNGLGLREWAIGATAALTAPLDTAVGVTASLVDRGIEVIVVAIAGLIAMTRLQLGKIEPEGEN